MHMIGPVLCVVFWYRYNDPYFQGFISGTKGNLKIAQEALQNRAKVFNIMAVTMDPLYEQFI